MNAGPNAAAPESGWHVYIVRCGDGTLYTGVARNVTLRLAEHNAGNGAKYTRSRRPVELVYTEPAGGRAAAQRREAAIKKLSAVQKRALAGLPPAGSERAYRRAAAAST